MPDQSSRQMVAFILIVSGSIVGLAGTDLVLPAIPALPSVLLGSLADAQLVLATFSFGVAIGLLLFGELGARYDQKRVLIVSLLCYGSTSILATFASSIHELSMMRFIQGLTSAAPAVFAPGMIRSLFDEKRAVRAIGLMGSIESMVPALAPVLGYWLLICFDWRASFVVTMLFCFLLTISWSIWGGAVPKNSTTRKASGYFTLLTNKLFMRYALSQAFTLGGLLIFVFGAPTVMTVTMHGELFDFVIMQVTGITFFVIAANTADRLVTRFGGEQTILAGSAMSTFGTLCIFLYALGGGNHPEPIWLMFILVNMGLGFRGPPGFYYAVVAAQDDDARGSALVILFVLLTAAIGTAIVAPLITFGLLPLSLAAAVVSSASLLVLAFMKNSA